MNKKSISKKQLREFGILLGLGFPILVGWIIPIMGGHMFRIWTLWVGLFFLILGILKPSLLFFPYRRWMDLGKSLGWINSRIILGLVFIIVVLPLAFIMKAFGYDPLRTKKSNIKSYRENKENHSIDLTKIF